MLTELPFGLAGRIFRSPMPWGDRDPDGKLTGEYRNNQVGMVVMLAGDEECKSKTGRDLQEYYRQQGWQVLYFPISDFGIPPSPKEMKDAVEKVRKYVNSGGNVAVHCSAGIGRTGLFLACLAKDVFGMSSAAALAWVRRYIPNAVETPAQARFLEDYGLCP